MRLINILYVPEFFLKSSTSHYNNNMTSGIFAGHNHDDHPIYGNILCDVKKCVGFLDYNNVNPVICFLFLPIL